MLLTPEVSESVDDDTKDEVEDNDDDDEVEQQIVQHPGNEQGLLWRGRRGGGILENSKSQII